MSSAATILNRSTMAATRFSDGNGLHIRVYYQDSHGSIKESFYDEGNGWALRGNGLVVHAKLNSPIAVVSWASGTQIRLYYLDNDNYIRERMYTGGSSWEDGGLDGYKIRVAHFSQLAAAQSGSGDNLRLRVYYQESSGKLRELRWAPGGWKNESTNLPDAVLGTSLACFGGLHSQIADWWLYYQDKDLQLKEILNKGDHWKPGAFKATGVFRPGASISVVAWGDVEIRVYGVNEKNELIETAYQGSGWTGTKALTTTVTDSGVAAIQWGNNPNVQIRLYYQRTATGAKEWVWNGKAWVSGAEIPIYSS